MKKKRNILLLIILFLSIGVTIAYLQSTDTFENIFNAGTYSIITHEEFTSPTNWKPGDTTPKTITTTNEGTIPVMVRVKFDESWASSNDEELPLNFAAGKHASIINLDNEIDWLYKEGYYYYLHELLPGEETTSPISGVTFNPEYEGNITCTFNQTTNSNECSTSDEYMGGTYTLNITTETVQSDAYETIWDSVPIMYDYVGDNPCAYNGELVPGTEYVNGQYKYIYRKKRRAGLTTNTKDDGWDLELIDVNSTNPVNTVACSSVNNKPIVAMSDTYRNSNATSINLSLVDTSNVTDMFGLFRSSTAQTINFSGVDTSKVTDMSGMFSQSQIQSLDLRSFNTSNVTNMSGMFSKSQATTIDLSSFNTSKVTNMSDMFYNSVAQTLDLSSFDTSNVTNMNYMFYHVTTTTGYAKTQADADRFNSSSNKPTTLTFVIKNS